MLIPFERLPDTARIYVYQADRKLNDEEAEILLKKTNAFIEGWCSHGQQLHGSATVPINRFLVIGVDERYQAVSNCAYDVSVEFIKAVQQEMGIDLLDRSKLLFRSDLDFFWVPIDQVRDYVKNGSISMFAKMFDNSVSTLKEWRDKWLVPVTNTWIRQYIFEGITRLV